ncbi:hypothetical protein [Flavobacterium sp. AG291]|uniref:hypothetical protein n=1 Tax=Flavobacterium sp. AG291 TaxID=2184000 RepID=UPI000E2C7CCC|nr:hypothetical protein [Flavobacterium sp. AG291]RDI14445.1 hypothetical protein DEU42_102138 [Flavobacterium sp. AG291]
MRYLYIICLLFSINVLGQVNSKTLAPDMMPKNPQASQFMRFGDMPIGKYTGTPQVTIPIYTVKAKGLEIPISLSYTSNGIKVVEEAGWVGLGWALQAEGSIVQNVQGTDDFGYYKNRNYSGIDCMIAYQSPVNPESLWASNTPFFLERSNLDDLLAFNACGFNEMLATGLMDTTPDKFTFSVLNYSGEFTLDWKTGKFECVTDKNITIIPSNSNTSNLQPSFVISVPDGHRFLFELKEETQAILNFSNTETAGLSSAIDITKSEEKTSRVYKLTQITTNNGDVITYNYITTAVSKNLPMISKNFTDYQISMTTGMGGFPLTDGEVTSRLATQQNYTYLSSINFSAGTVNFASSSRTDLKEGRKLDKIEVRNTKGEYIKDFNFTYDYFVANTSGTNWDTELNFGGYSADKTTQELTQRLKLVAVQEVGIKPYTFEYNSQTLPKKTSYAVDFWGYYNGISGNTSFMPNIYSFNLEQNNQKFVKYYNNNRSPSPQYCRAGILEKINYPTGGYTTFNWEMNTFDNVGIPDISYDANKYISVSTLTPTTTQSVYLTADYTLFKGSAQLSTLGCTDPNAYANCYVKIQVFKPELMAYLESLGGLSSYGLNGVMGINGFINGTNSQYNTYINNVIYVQKAYNDPIEKFINDLTFNLPKGIIVFEVRGGCGTYSYPSNTSQANLQLTFKDITPLPALSKGAGMRLASVVSQTGAGQIAMKKNYTYEGGKLMSAPVFLNKASFKYYWTEFQSENQIPPMRTFIGTKCVLSSNSFISASQNAKGFLVGYDKVTEIQVSNDLQNTPNGAVVEYYQNQPVSSAAIGYGAYTDLSIPEPIQLPSNGLIKVMEIKNASGALIKKQTNEYQKVVNDVNWGMKVGIQGNFYVYTDETYYYPDYLIGFYPIISGQSLLKKTITEEYITGSPALVENINYSYDSYNQLSYEQKTSITGDITEKYFKYPYNFNSSDPNSNTLQQMVANNTINIPTEIKSYINSTLVSTERTEYYRRLGSNGYQYPDIFHPTLKKLYKGDENLGYKVNYLRYDANGNLIEYEIGGKRTCLIYGYNLSLPVAMIENIQYSAIPSGLISSIQSASDTGTETTLLSALSALRNDIALKDSMVTSYTYKLLLGISTIIDPKGLKTTYQYDSVGRLEFIRDANNYIMSEYKYNYKP